MKSHLIHLLIIAGLVLAAGCNKKPPASQNKGPLEGPQVASAHDVSSIAGIHWTRPEGWVVGAPRQMRIATYDVPAAGGDNEGGECAIFYFGSGQGGDVDQNINRWVDQFENPGKVDRSSKVVNGMSVTMVKIAGTYLAPSGPMMESQGKKENYRLLGAIVNAPEGMVFFKYTGPAKTVEASEGEFNSLIESLAKD